MVARCCRYVRWPAYCVLFSLLASCVSADPPTSSSSSAGRISADDFQYRGVFRLPHVSGGDSNWEYSGYAMTYWPGGDATGDDDGHPGSLFIVGHDHQQMLAEVSIPKPVVSETKQLNSLPTATMLQPFTDILSGQAAELEIPRMGIEYLSDSASKDSGALHWCIGQHFEFESRPTHGIKGVQLNKADAHGRWFLDGYSAYVLNDYLFEIPDSWSQKNLPGFRLATGRFRDGQWGGLGPALVAYQAPDLANPPAENAVIENCRPLLMYGQPLPGTAELDVDPDHSMNRFSESDEWSGGAWLTAGNRAAVMLIGTKAVGKTWYGFSNGVVYPISGDPNDPIPEVPEYPHDQRGWWSESIRAQAILFDPDDLAKVARGEWKSWQPQPYQTIDLTTYLFESTFEYERQKRYLLGAAAFDRQHGLLYVIERRVKVDDERSVVHVFEIN